MDLKSGPWPVPAYSVGPPRKSGARTSTWIEPPYIPCEVCVQVFSPAETCVLMNELSSSPLMAIARQATTTTVTLMGPPLIGALGRSKFSLPTKPVLVCGSESGANNERQILPVHRRRGRRGGGCGRGSRGGMAHIPILCHQTIVALISHRHYRPTTDSAPLPHWPRLQSPARNTPSDYCRPRCKRRRHRRSKRPGLRHRRGDHDRWR